MSETLYRKYRPKNFGEIIGQSHIVRTLSNSIKNGRLGHAYLFTGPRGTGKTSIARIMAKTINCENPKEAITCEKCRSCENITTGKTLDIIEIDAASNTGVDNIRELKETISLPPTLLKYKVYIIDEVHMLSGGAFNALLKTLEEPPTHSIFILATTEIHKVPETIISRCQRFDFTRLPLENIIEKLSLIAKNEKVKVGKEALEMIAIASEGGMRDAESLLGQIISLEDKNITNKEVDEILGTTDRAFIEIICEKIIEKDSSSAIAKINELIQEGYNLQVFNKSLINYFRQLMLVKVDEKLKDYFTYEMTSQHLKKIIELSQKITLPEIIRIINLLIESQNKISSFLLPQLALEIAIIRATNNFPDSSPVPIKTITPEKITSYAVAPMIDKNNNEAIRQYDKKLDDAISNSKIENQINTEKNSSTDYDTAKANWNRLLIDIRPFNHSLSALLSNCQIIKVNGKEITLGTPYSFYQEKLNDPKNRLTIEDVFSKILGLRIRLKVTIDKNIVPKKTQEKETEKEPGEQSSLLSSAMEIMGGKIVE